MARGQEEPKLFTREIVTRATIDSFKKLDPRHQLRNPVMFVVEVGSVDHHRHLLHQPDRRRRPGAVVHRRHRRSGCGSR